MADRSTPRQAPSSKLMVASRAKFHSPQHSTFHSRRDSIWVTMELSAVGIGGSSLAAIVLAISSHPSTQLPPVVGAQLLLKKATWKSRRGTLDYRRRARDRFDYHTVAPHSSRVIAAPRLHEIGADNTNSSPGGGLHCALQKISTGVPGVESIVARHRGHARCR